MAQNLRVLEDGQENVTEEVSSEMDFNVEPDLKEERLL
jgi:hypothetical protein